MTSPDTLIIGAGAAGIACARRLRAAGRSVLVLEASGRVGGRAWTAYPAELGGAWFDMGAIWLHAAEHNPVAHLAREAGVTLLSSDAIRTERSFVGSRPANVAELREYEGAWDRFTTAAERILSGRADAPLAAVADSLPDDPWALTVEAWEGPVICCAEAAQLSLRDWHDNALNGANLVPEGGIGAFLATLAHGLDVRLHTPVSRIRWDGPAGGVEVTTAGGTIRAGAAIVTVSTGVLSAGLIHFDPPLPADTSAAIADLPMGLAVKVVLRAAGCDRLDLPPHCALDHQVRRRGEPFMVFNCWPYGRDYVQGWIGGAHAWELARLGQEAACDFALGELRKMLGGRVDRAFAGGARLVSRWDAEPFVRGAYSWVAPGRSDARARLARPLAGGRLIFAGEACHVGYTGTVGGAWLSGEAAADAILSGRDA